MAAEPEDGRYQLVMFDLGGVVVEVESDRLVLQAAQTLGRPFDEVQAAIYHEELLLPLELGQVSLRHYYDGLNAKLTLPWTFEQFARAWTGIFREQPGTMRLIERLKKRYRLAALSNTNDHHLARIKADYPVLSAFSFWVASCEVGLRKPDPKIYQLALERAGVRAQAAIYIDDRPELVAAGRAVGLTAIRFESAAQLEQELLQLGVALGCR
jgi:putative hydrolase of the HAD superfamily